jgi:biofilm protein TabA
MIFGDLKYWKQEERAFSPTIRSAMEYLQSMDFTQMKAGKYEIDGNRMFCIVSESTTKSRQELKAESHEIYMDIQYIVTGEEKIGFARLTDEQIVIQDLIQSDDAFLYDDLQDEMELILSSGTYAMFFPADLHRPGWKLQEESQLKKVVIKVKLDF